MFWNGKTDRAADAHYIAVCKWVSVAKDVEQCTFDMEFLRTWTERTIGRNTGSGIDGNATRDFNSGAHVLPPADWLTTVKQQTKEATRNNRHNPDSRLAMGHMTRPFKLWGQCSVAENSIGDWYV